MSDRKPSNPKDALGIAKVPFSTLSAPVVAEEGLAMLEGALKYARHNYREVGVRGSVYYDAAMRHLTAWWEGEDIDPDSGIHHLSKARACLGVLRDSQIRGNWVDDRPPVTDAGWQKAMNKRVELLLAKYPNPPAPCIAAAVERALRIEAGDLVRCLKTDILKGGPVVGEIYLVLKSEPGAKGDWLTIDVKGTNWSAHAEDFTLACKATP